MPLDYEHARTSLKKIMNRFPLQNSALVEARKKELTSKSRSKIKSSRKVMKKSKKSVGRSRLRKNKTKLSQEVSQGRIFKTFDSTI
jgi:hypothetical protein